MRCARILLILNILLLSLLALNASAANIDPTGSGNQYAWSENRGWINFNPGYGPGVNVTATDVTGLAWGENLGWIDLAPAYGGVTNDGNGNLAGYAWSENGGWIDFHPSGGGVTIGSDGSFSGYAWGENIGWISFDVPNVGVKSSWLIPYLLDIVVSGNGTVHSSTNPVTADINCSGACTQAYNSGTMVTLTASPNTGYSFTGWGGACSGSGSGSCSVTMSQAQNVTALFTQLSYMVTTSVSGGTGGSITPAGSSVNYGSPVTFTITPTSGYTLSSLTDNGTAVTATAEANGSYTYTISSVTANQTLLATFSPVVVTPTPVPALNPLSLVVAAIGLGGMLARKKRTSTQYENG
jgi:hypothetical protein